MQTFFNFFALTNRPGNRVLRLRLSRDVQSNLTETFRNQRQELLDNTTKIDFEAGYQPEKDEILEIKNFDDIDNLHDLSRNPSAIDLLEPDEEIYSSIKAIFSTSDIPTELLFQNFDQRQIISNSKLALLWHKDTYVKIDKPGITINKKLAVILNQTSLLFQSFWNAKKVFDLSDYFREATAEELQTFLCHDTFAMQQIEKLRELFDSTMRKKVCQILKSGVLNYPIHQIKTVAETMQQHLSVDENDRLVLPAEKKDLKRILRFFAEDYYLSPITETLYVSNSKRSIAQ